MHASSFLVLVAGVMSAAAQSTTTSTSTMTAYITLTQCNPTNTLCPLYKPSSTSSSIVSTTSSSAIIPTTYSAVAVPSSSSAAPVYSVKTFPALNTTTSTPAAATFPTAAFYNTTTPKYTAGSSKPATLTSAAAIPSQSVPAGKGGNGGYPTAPSPIPTAGAATLQSGLVMGVMGAIAAMLL